MERAGEREREREKERERERQMGSCHLGGGKISEAEPERAEFEGPVSVHGWVLVVDPERFLDTACSQATAGVEDGWFWIQAVSIVECVFCGC